MTHERRFTTEKIGKRIELAKQMTFRNKIRLDPFRYLPLPDADTDPPLGADPAAWPEIEWNSYWAGQNQNYFLSSSFTVPKGWARGQLGMHLPMGTAGDIFTHPESLVYIDGEPFASADRYHHTLYLPERLADGLPHRLELHGWTGLTGWPPNPKDATRLFMKGCSVVDVDFETRDFIIEAEVALEVAKKLDADSPTRIRILNALDAAFLRLDTRDPLGDAFYRSIPGATEVLREKLDAAGEPMDVTLHAIGHAHMDVAYLWPVSQIRRKNARTYSNVLRLMERFPGYKFSHSQPQLYDYTRQDYPEIFDAIKDRVAEGRWEVMGGMWVEPDCNIPGGEALVRQLILGRGFFREHFGEAETPVLWLPDVFGLSWCLPQLIKKSGLKWVLSNKFSWNQYNQMTASTIWWQGIDGSRVLTHFLTTPRVVQHLPFPTNYKSDLSAHEVIGTWEKNMVKEQIDELPICYGYGDGGGGPTGPLIRRAEIFQNMPGAPRVKFSTAREFFEAIEAKPLNLNVWNDELYLEGHRGVLTSQAWIKRANRKAEMRMHEAEFLGALAVLAGAKDLPKEALTEAWKLLCLNQFHDILPGTSVTEVFADSREDYAEIDRLAEEYANAALEAVMTEGEGATVINAIPFKGRRHVIVPEGIEPKGTSQEIDGGRIVQIEDVAPYSLTPLRGDAPSEPVTVTEAGGSIVLENARLKAEFSAEADLVRLYDKEFDREVLATGETGNVLQIFEDRPLSWDAWDIDSFFEDRGEIVRGLVSMRVVETGPLRAAIEIQRSFRSSTLTQRVEMCADSARLDFVTKVDWHETHILLKVAFPVSVLSPKATYEIQWGSIERPTHRNTMWDYAKFEVAAQKWADLSEGDYGVALLNDCKYGYDIRDHVMRLSLIKSATMPDPKADQGLHEFTYSLFPHGGDWRNNVIHAAYAQNQPARCVLGRAPEHLVCGLISTDDKAAVVETVKPSEDGTGVVFRVFDAHRKRGSRAILLGAEMREIVETNLLEEVEGFIGGSTDRVDLPLSPFEIKTLLCRPR